LTIAAATATFKHLNHLQLGSAIFFGFISCWLFQIIETFSPERLEAQRRAEAAQEAEFARQDAEWAREKAEEAAEKEAYGHGYVGSWARWEADAS